MTEQMERQLIDGVELAQRLKASDVRVIAAGSLQVCLVKAEKTNIAQVP